MADTVGGGMGGSDPGGGLGSLSSGSMMGLGALGLGAAGFGAILGQGEPKLPWQFGQLSNNAALMEQQGGTLFGEGQQLYGQGAAALGMAQQGQLTTPQQAQLTLESQKLNNQASQAYASMGRNINQDTSGISTQANIDTQINAMAQQQIQSTIALGLGEIQTGGSMTGQALGFENAANQALVQAGEAQLKNDQAYSTALTGAFTSIATIMGSVAKII
jgi:hypothetical protein